MTSHDLAPRPPRAADAPLPRSVSEVLLDVLNVATLAASTPQAAFGHRAQLESLRAEVAAAVARPAEDVRVIDDMSIFVVQAALHLAGNRWNEPRWRQLVEFLLPHIRRDWKAALMQEMRPISRDDLR